MDSTSNSTKVTVDIGASGSYKGVVQQAMTDFGGLWQKIGEGKMSTALTVAGFVGIGAAITGAVKQAADYQQSLTRLVTSAGESQSNLGMVSAGIKSVSESTGTSLSQLTAAMYIIESGGQHGANGLDVLKASAQGAKTENADLATVADAVTSILQDYHLKATDSADVTSKLVAAVGAGKTNFQELAGSLHSVLPAASAAHISMNDILGDIASMTVHGMSADQATQNLAEAIRSLQSPSQSASQYLSSIGINAADLSDKLSKEGLSGTLQDVSNAIMQNMGPGGKVLINSFNESKSAAQDAQEMISKMPASLQTLAKEYLNGSITASQWRKDTRGLSAGQTNLANQFASVANMANGFNSLLKSGSPAALSYSQALQKATGNATTMNVALMLTGENAGYTNNAISSVSKATSEAGGNVKGWSEIQKNFNQQLSEVVNTFKVWIVDLGQIFLPILTNILAHFRDFLKIASWIAPIAGAILLVVGAMKTWQLIIKGVELAQLALNAIMDTNPIVLAIMAVVAVALLLLTHWKQVKQWFEDFLKFMVGLGKMVIEAIGDAGKWLYDIGKDVVNGLIHGITDMVGDAEKAIKGVAHTIVSGVKGFLGIHSPSTVFAEIGTNMGQGLINGIQGMTSKANIAVNSLVTGQSQGSNVMPTTSQTFTTNNSYGGSGGSTTQITIGQVVLYTPAASQEFFNQINRDTQLQGMGLTPAQGIA